MPCSGYERFVQENKTRYMKTNSAQDQPFSMHKTNAFLIFMIIRITSIILFAKQLSDKTTWYSKPAFQTLWQDF